MLQDPTEQVDIDNFMVQQLDGTSNNWGWCKQKVLSCNNLCFESNLSSNILVFISTSFDVVKTITAWSKCYSCGVTCCVQSRSHGEEDSSLPGLLLNNDTTMYNFALLKF